MQLRRLLSAVVVATGVAAATACTSTTPTAPLPAGELQAALRTAATPIASIDSAAERLEVACLNALGWSVPTPPRERHASNDSMLGFVGLRADPTSIGAAGFATTVVDRPSTTESFAATLTGDEATSFEVALRGAVPASVTSRSPSGSTLTRTTGGCQGTADERLFGGTEGMLSTYGILNDVLALAADPRVGRAFDAALPSYRACMADRGLAVKGLDARSVARERFGTYRATGDAPSDAEAALAKSDADCQRDSDIHARTERAFFDVAAGWMRDHETSIRRVAAIAEDAQRAASTVP